MPDYEEIQRRLTVLDGVRTEVARFQGVHFTFASVTKGSEEYYIQELRHKFETGEWRYCYWLKCSDGPKLIASSAKSKFDKRVVQKRLFLTQPI